MITKEMDKNIQGTNDFSTISKCSMVQQGYFEDKYVAEFLFGSKCSRRTPLIHMGYFARAIIIDSVLKFFLKFVGTCASQVISCGAGYDTSYFRLSENFPQDHELTYYEIDFKNIVSQKAEYIKGSKILSGTLDLTNSVEYHNIVLWTPSYRLVAADLRKLGDLENALEDAGVLWHVPTLFLAECSITYMDEVSSTRLIEWAARKFHDASFATFEQIHPEDGFGNVMKQHFNSLNSPLLSLDCYPTLEAQNGRYKKCGWEECESRSAYDALRYIIDQNKLLAAFTLEPFDEFESWHLMCCHYTLTIASKGHLKNWCRSFMKQELSESTGVHIMKSAREKVHWSFMTTLGQPPERFGHASARINDNCVVLVGGFGKKSNGEHGRMREFCNINLKDLSVKQMTLYQNSVTNSAVMDAVHHTCTSLPDGRLLLIGGRTSPKSPANLHPIIFSHTEYSINALNIKGPCPRWRHTATGVGNTFQILMVMIFGGRTESLEVLDDLWLLQPFVQVFEEVNKHSDWPRSRFSHSAAMNSKNNCVLISGGLDQTIQPLSDVWNFNIEFRSWEKFEIDGPQCLPRYSHTSAVTEDGNFLLLVGGVNTLAEWQPGVCVIDLLLNNCCEYSLPAQDPEKPIMLHNHTSELMEDGMLLVFGGGGNCFSFGTSFNPGILNVNIAGLLQQNKASAS